MDDFSDPQPKQTEAAEKEKLADRLAALAKILKRANQQDLARALLHGSVRIRVEALDLHGRLTAAAFLGQETLRHSDPARRGGSDRGNPEDQTQ